MNWIHIGLLAVIFGCGFVFGMVAQEIRQQRYENKLQGRRYDY
jgi:citrate synthase